MDDTQFRQKVTLLCDPYFDREFFTNLIFCIDRKKSSRELFEAVMREISGTQEFKPELDRALLHLFYSMQALSALKINYQWLPIAQGIYSVALFRGDGSKMVPLSHFEDSRGQASTPKEFESMIRREVRAVESEKMAWEALLFLLENRSTRTETIKIWLKQAILDCDPLSFGLIVKGLELSLASGWKATAKILKRPFDRFWRQEKAPNFLTHAFRLAQVGTFQISDRPNFQWKAGWGEDIWQRASTQSAEAVWESLQTMVEAGANFDQIFSLLTALRGRALFAMKVEQWPRVCWSALYSDLLHSASRWVPEERLRLLALNVFDLVRSAQIPSNAARTRPSGDEVLDGASKNISKDRLVLRLDDAVEKGDRSHALELMAAILRDQGLSHSIGDRLLLMASKQDGWTFDCMTIPIALTLTQSHEAILRLKINEPEIIQDTAFGLLRFLSDQREASLAIVPKTGTYGDGLPRSQYDVSAGARIVDRFVFNQLRNAQRVKVWPSNN